MSPSRDSSTPPSRRRAPRGTTVKVSGLSLSRATWATVEALVAQMERAGIPRAHPSGALDLLVLRSGVADEILEGGTVVFRCEVCGKWPDDFPAAQAHEREHSGHSVQSYKVPSSD